MFGNLYRVDVLQLLDQQTTELLSRWSEGLELEQAPLVPHEELVEAFRERRALSRLVRQNREDLENIDLAMLPFLLPHQKIHLRQRLVRAHYLTAVQARIDEIEFRWDGLLANKAQCTHYASLLRSLDAPFYAKNPEKLEQLTQLTEDSEKPMAWFGAKYLAPMMATLMVELCAGNTSAIKNFLVSMDRKTTYLGWSRTFILTFFNLLPQVFAGDPADLAHLRDTGVLLSYMNLSIVNANFAIECYLILKNTFAGALQTRHQHLHLDVWEQFKTQIKQRRFVLLNLLFSSLMYVASFLCFSGFIDLWPWGPFFSLGCRLVQLVLVAARYHDEETTYYANVKRILDQINQLNDQEQHLLYEIAHAADEDEKARLRHKIKLILEDRQLLENQYRKTKNDWLLKKDEYTQQLTLSSCFFAGVMLFSCMIFPTTIIAPPIGLALGLAGAAICIIFVIALSVMRARFEMQRKRQNMLQIHQPELQTLTVPDEQLNIYMRRFMILKDSPDSLEKTLEMKQCYLRMLQLVNRSGTQAQLLEHQEINLRVRVARDILIPVVALSMFLVIPTPIGLGVIAGLILLYFVTKKVLEAYRPVVDYPLKFNEQAYDKFAAHPSPENLGWINEGRKYQNKFFSPKKSGDALDDFTPDFVLGQN